MSPRFEAALARLYTDRDALDRFLADPQREAALAGLDAGEATALSSIDPVDLRLAAQSFSHKRSNSRQRSFLARLRRIWDV